LFPLHVVVAAQLLHKEPSPLQFLRLNLEGLQNRGRLNGFPPLAVANASEQQGNHPKPAKPADVKVAWAAHGFASVPVVCTVITLLYLQ
jgi:hypothetical protein